MDQEPRPASVAVRGTVRAGITGFLRGLESSTVLLVLILVAGGVVSSIVTSWSPWGGGVMLAACVVGVGLVLLRWWRSAPDRDRMETGITIASRTPGHELDITAPLSGRESLFNLVVLIREISQNRRMLPPPKGEVRGGNPSDKNSLREYSPKEREAVMREWSESIPEYDREVLERVAAAQKALEPSTEKTPLGESAPIQQPEDKS
jgi:hypothetical protein